MNNIISVLKTANGAEKIIVMPFVLLSIPVSAIFFLLMHMCKLLSFINLRFMTVMSWLDYKIFYFTVYPSVFLLVALRKYRKPTK